MTVTSRPRDPAITRLRPKTGLNASLDQFPGQSTILGRGEATPGNSASPRMPRRRRDLGFHRTPDAATRDIARQRKHHEFRDRFRLPTPAPDLTMSGQRRESHQNSAWVAGPLDNRVDRFARVPLPPPWSIDVDPIWDPERS
jgi:hypothetical protein